MAGKQSNEWSQDHEKLLNYCAKKVLRRSRHHNYVDVDELVNVGWLKNLRRRKPGQLKGCATFTIANMNECLHKSITGNSRLKRDTIGEPRALPDKVIESPLRHAIHHEQIDMAISLLDELEPWAREVLQRYYLGGETFAAIGQSLGRTKEAIRVRHRKAMEKLKELWIAINDKEKTDD